MCVRVLRSKKNYSKRHSYQEVNPKMNPNYKYDSTTTRRNRTNKIAKRLSSCCGVMDSSNYSSPAFRFGVRISVIVCLLLTAILIGVGSYLILSSLQQKAQKDQYEAITRKIESSTASAIMDKQDA